MHDSRSVEPTENTGVPETRRESGEQASAIGKCDEGSCTVTDVQRAAVGDWSQAPPAKATPWPNVEPEPGCWLGGRFELIERLGSGGMAAVFRAHDAVLDRTVAIKFLVDKALDTDEGLERLQLEARACGQLN